MRKKVLIMALVDPSTNPRPQRLIAFLQELNFEIHVASFLPLLPLDVHQNYIIPKPSMSLGMRIMRKSLRFLSSILPLKSLDILFENIRWGLGSVESQISKNDYDVIFVEDLFLLPLALKYFQGSKIIFDAREYFPGELEEGFIWRMVEKPYRERICRQYLPQCGHIMTVSPGLVRQYKKNFNVDAVLVRSLPYLCTYEPTLVSSDRIRIVHHGIANRDRRLENLIDIFSYLEDRFELDLYLGGNDAYISDLKKISAKLPKIKILPLVPFAEIIPTLNDYDIGLCYFEPASFNLTHCLPNKFFEFIQARLMLATGPTPDMLDILNQYKLGVSAKEFTSRSMADALNNLTADDIYSMKCLSHKAAQTLCYEVERQKIADILSSIDMLEES